MTACQYLLPRTSNDIRNLLFAKTGISSSLTHCSMEARSGRASTKTASTPMRLNSRALVMASSQPRMRASVRARIKMSWPSSLASQAAWMRAYASPRETTDFPLVCPQPVHRVSFGQVLDLLDLACDLRLGQVWSSIMTPAAPALAKFCTVLLTFSGLP